MIKSRKTTAFMWHYYLFIKTILIVTISQLTSILIYIEYLYNILSVMCDMSYDRPLG